LLLPRVGYGSAIEMSLSRSVASTFSRSPVFEPHPGAAAILGDEFDAGSLEGALNSFNRPLTKLIPPAQA
jgi:hypothetical protein